MGWLKTQKLEYLENGTWLFYETKKFLTCASDGTFWEHFEHILTGFYMITASVMKELRRPGRLLNLFCTFNLPPLYRMYKKIQTRYYPQFLSTSCSEYIENKKICRVSFSPWMFHRWHRCGYVLLLLLVLLMMMMLLLLLFFVMI